MSNNRPNMMFVTPISKKLPGGQEITVIYALNVDDQCIYRWDWKTGSWIVDAKSEE